MPAATAELDRRSGASWMLVCRGCYWGLQHATAVLGLQFYLGLQYWGCSMPKLLLLEAKFRAHNPAINFYN